MLQSIDVFILKMCSRLRIGNLLLLTCLPSIMIICCIWAFRLSDGPKTTHIGLGVFHVPPFGWVQLCTWLNCMIHIAACFQGSGNEGENFLDGCQHVYLDMGTNTGVQIRKLFEPHLFPNASVLPIFDKFFGRAEKRKVILIMLIRFFYFRYFTDD